MFLVSNLLIVFIMARFLKFIMAAELQMNLEGLVSLEFSEN